MDVSLPGGSRTRYRIVVRLNALAVVAAVTAAACGGKPSPPSNSQDAPRRLLWSQPAPTRALIDRYRFALFVDGMRSLLASADCTGAAPLFECAAPLPQLAAGPHVLELSTLDQLTGLESLPSASLTLTGRATAPSSLEITLPSGPTAVPPPVGGSRRTMTESCVRDASTCFVVAAISDDAGPVQQLAALPDGRLLALFPGGIVRIFPEGESELLDIDRRGEAVDIADVAIDPDFLTNRFVYLATVASAGAGRVKVSVVRMRELAGRLGEPATIVTDLPASAQGRPAVSVGPDRRIYVAIPASDQPSTNGPYDGLVLRLTPDGAAAGYERLSSPILALGHRSPSSFGWMDGAHLLVASSSVTNQSPLAIVPLQIDGAWPAPIVPLALPLGFAAGVKRVAAGLPPGPGAESTLFLLAVNPSVLYVARVATDTHVGVMSLEPIPLGSVTPTAFTVAANGDVILAARDDGNLLTQLLQLHAR